MESIQQLWFKDIKMQILSLSFTKKKLQKNLMNFDKIR